VRTSITWKCPSCECRRTARFCSSCGEERLRPTDLTIPDVVAQLARNVSEIDGRLLRSFRTILVAPGALTAAHIKGQRRSYLGPLALFFVANALFVLLQSLTGEHVLSSPLASHLHQQDWSDLARTMVDQRLRTQDRSLAEYSVDFNEAATFNAKALMVLMVLAFAPCALALFSRPHRPAGAHVVFALHVYAFVMVLLCGALLLAQAQESLGGRGLASPTLDKSLTVFNLVCCALYIHAALGPAYGETGASRVAKACVLALVVGGLFVAYRFAIFVITLYST
jgi:hypothetical protein